MCYKAIERLRPQERVTEMSTPIVDTHQHLWDPEVIPCSWLKRVPSLNRAFGMSDYLEATKGLGVVKSVHVETDVDEPYMEQETKALFRLADRNDNPLSGIVASARPEKDGFEQHLEKILGHRALKGIRRILHTEPDELGQGKTFIENVGRLGSYGLSFDICVLARQLPVAINLVSRCPDVTFILDHCGVPQVKERVLDTWRADITEMAKFANVFGKISGVVAYADPANWTKEDLRPYIEHMIESFGWDRIMFGSDWPVCTLSASYAQWVDALQSITSGAGLENQGKLFHDNAVRVYRL